MVQFDNMATNTNASGGTSAATEVISLQQKIAYAVGVYLMVCVVAFNTMVLFYKMPFIWWWPCFFVGNALFVVVVAQFMCEAIERKTKWSKVDWKLVFSGAVRYTCAFCGGSPVIWWCIVKVHECADLKGPMKYVCPQEGGKEASAFYSPHHDDWNTDTAAWIIFLPMLLMKMSLYETLFDLGFYVQHRLYHEIPWLYRMIHKDHHTLSDHQKSGEEPLLKSWHTMNQAFVEVLCTFGLHIPCMAFFSFCVFGFHPLLRITGLDASIIFGCIICWEHLGHVDSAFAGTTVMPACIITAQILGLQKFGAKEHIVHHLVLTSNYSKRFVIWDQIFGTSEIADGGVGKWFKK